MADGMMMRRVLALVLVAATGCETPGRDQNTVDASIDAGEALPDRQVNNVIGGPTKMYWSHGQFACSLEFGCPEGPTVSAYEALGERVSAIVDGGVGTSRVAGHADELFYLYGKSRGAMYVNRLDGSGNVALSIPRLELTGPTVDDTYVYWAENDSATRNCVIRKALRSGKGDDAASIAVSGDRIENLTYAAGYLWWTETDSGVLKRVPVAGGMPQLTNVDSVTVLSASEASVLVGRVLPNPAEKADAQIGRIDATGTYEVLITHLQIDRAPRYLVEYGSSIFWSVSDGNVYSGEPGGPINVIPAEDTSGFVFVVLPGELLVDFNRHGFRRIFR